MHCTHTVDIQLPAAQVMAVTGHRSEVQMRRDYLPPKQKKNKVGTKLGYWGRHVSMGGMDAENRERAQLQM